MKQLFFIMLCMPSLLAAHSIKIINNTGATLSASPSLLGCQKMYSNALDIGPDRGPNNPYVISSGACCYWGVALTVKNGAHQGKRVTAGNLENQQEARSGICRDSTFEIQIKDNQLKSFRK